MAPAQTTKSRLAEGCQNTVRSNAVMETHFMIFVTIGASFLRPVSPYRRSEGADLARPAPNEKTCQL